MSIYSTLRALHINCHFQSTERNGDASNTGIGRWLKNGAVLVNGERANFESEYDSIDTLVLFPKGKRKTTIR